MAKRPPKRTGVSWRSAPLAILTLCGGLLLPYGCARLRNPLSVFRSQSPEAGADTEQDGPRLVGDLAIVANAHPIKAEGYGLVVNLRGTGSDAPLGPVRDHILGEMRVHRIDRPEQLLASKNTAVVAIQAWLRPAIQEGDTFDVAVRAYGAETTSLRGGDLLLADLKEMPQYGGMQFEGRRWGRASGPILVDPTAKTVDKSADMKQGRILGGGYATKPRELLLVLKPEHQKFFNARRIDYVINQRFAYFDGGIKRGVANAQDDSKILLKVPVQYQDNIPHYAQVVRAIALRSTPNDDIERLQLLEKQLMDPITSRNAALELEAIGPESKEVLKRGMRANSAEVRFFSAQSLAYMGEMDAARTLAQLARDESAFRVHALAALAVMNDFESEDALFELLHGTSVETRYGAFRALTARCRRDSYTDPRISGIKLGNKFQFNYHVLDVQGAPLVHVTYNRRPEIVLFGVDQWLKPPLALDAGPHILVRSLPDGRIKISRFAADSAQDQSRIVSPRLDEVIRGIVDLGGAYPDVVQALQQADAQKVLSSRFAVDALPEAGRYYERSTDAESQVDYSSQEARKKTFWERTGLAWLVPKKQSEDWSSAETDEPIY